MPDKNERERILRLLQKQAPVDDVKSFTGPESMEDVDAVFSELGLDADNLLDRFASPFESDDLEQEVFEAYAMDRCTDDERRMVDAMIEIDPRLRETVAMVRREIEAAATWSPPEVVEQQKSLLQVLREAMRRPALRYSLEFAVSLAGAAVIAFLFIGNRSSISTSGGSKPPSGSDSMVLAMRDKDRQISTLRKNWEDTQTQLSEVKARPPIKVVIPPTEIAKDGDRSIVSIGGGKVAMVLTNDLHGNAYKESGIRKAGIVQFDLGGKPNRTMVDPTSVTLRWKAPGGVKPARYVVDVAGKKLLAIDNRFTLPEGLLKPGQLYVWQVFADVRGKRLESSHAEFRTITTDEIRQVGAIRRDKNMGHLDKAIRLAKLGLRDEARSELDRIKWRDSKAKVNIRKAIVGD